MKKLKSLMLSLSLLFSLTVFGQITESPIRPEYRFVKDGDTLTVFKISTERKLVDELRWKQYWEKKHNALYEVSKQQDTSLKYCLLKVDNCEHQNKELVQQKNIRDTEINACNANKKGLKRQIVMWQIVAGAELLVFGI